MGVGKRIVGETVRPARTVLLQRNVAMNDPTELRKEASRCRETALDYLSRAEAPFLMQAARAFEDIASRIDRAEDLRSDKQRRRSS